MDSLAQSSSVFSPIIQSFGVLFMGDNFLRLLGGLLITIRIAAISVVFSICLGFLLGIVMTLKNALIKAVCKIYLEFMRIMPQMVLLFLAYFGISRAWGVSLSGEVASILVFTLWGTAEMGDLVRSSLESIPSHQYESARAVGLTEFQVFFYVVLPQTIRRLVPLAIKTTSLVVFVGVIEIVKIGQQIIDANRLTVPSAAIAVYATIFFMYFIVCWVLNLLASVIERRNK